MMQEERAELAHRDKAVLAGQESPHNSPPVTKTKGLGKETPTKEKILLWFSNPTQSRFARRLKDSTKEHGKGQGRKIRASGSVQVLCRLQGSYSLLMGLEKAKPNP